MPCNVHVFDTPGRLTVLQRLRLAWHAVTSRTASDYSSGHRLPNYVLGAIRQVWVVRLVDEDNDDLASLQEWSTGYAKKHDLRDAYIATPALVDDRKQQ